MATSSAASRRALLDISHPSQAWVLRSVREGLIERGFDTRVVARDKDVTLDLLRGFGVPFESLSVARRGTFGAARELVERELRFYGVTRRYRPHLLVGTSVHAARAAWLFGGRSVILNEDDAAVVPRFTRLAYPLASRIVTPQCLSFERWGSRHRTYPGTQKLFYLHRARFSPDREIATRLGLSPPYALVRFSSLQAHHDAGRRGLDRSLVTELARRVSPGVRVIVSMEEGTPPEGTTALEAPLLAIHHVMASARFVLSDSQSMTAEAALLGVPAIRVNDFVGRITSMAELERRGLAWGFRPENAGDAADLAVRAAEDDAFRDTVRRSADAYFAEIKDPLPWLLDELAALADHSD